jgi:hypothetical protein
MQLEPMNIDPPFRYHRPQRNRQPRLLDRQHLQKCYHDLNPFASLEITRPKGWIDVPLEEGGGGSDGGNTLKAFLIQVKVVEHHSEWEGYACTRVEDLCT